MEEDGDSTRINLIGPLGVAIETHRVIPAEKGEDTDKLGGMLVKRRSLKAWCDIPSSKQVQQ